MSLFLILFKAISGISRPIIVLIAHLPILLIAAGLLPALLIGVSIHPDRYAGFVGTTISKLHLWSRHVIAAVNAPPPDGRRTALETNQTRYSAKAVSK